jgi:Spy/CpxP family protein refolding chaperone
MKKLLIPLLFSLVAFAQPPGRGDRGPAALKTYLNLTDAQVTQLREVQRADREAMRTSFEAIRTKREALNALNKAGNATPAQLGQLMQEIGALEKSMAANRDAQRGKLMQVLTPDQQTKLTALQEAMKLMPAAHEAAGMGLLAPPEGGPRMGRFAGRGPGGPPMGNRFGRGPGGPGPRF